MNNYKYLMSRNLTINNKNYNGYINSITSYYSINPFSNTSYASQGLCIIKGNIFISAYDTNKYGDSKIKIISSNNTIKTLSLNCKSHVGGIAYDSISNKIYISYDNNKNSEKDKISGICIYDYDEIMSLNDNSILWVDDNLNNNYFHKYITYSKKDNINEINSVSFLTCYDNYLYAGEFNKNIKTKINKYKINKDGTIGNLVKTLYCPCEKIQGMCIHEYNNKEYYIFSSSYGRKNRSNIMICKLDDDIFTGLAICKVPCMIEGISFIFDNIFGAVYENSCTKYKYGTDGKGLSEISFDTIDYFDFEKLIHAYEFKTSEKKETMKKYYDDNYFEHWYEEAK